MVLFPLLALLYLLPTTTADTLRCQTFMGSANGESGEGIETCVVPVSHCIARSYQVFGTQTYTLSCDDLFQCVGIRDDTCCTTSFGVVVRCFDKNFENPDGTTMTRVDNSFFTSDTCSQACGDDAIAIDEANGPASSSLLCSFALFLTLLLATSTTIF